MTLGQVDEDAKTRRDAPGSVYEHDMKVGRVLIIYLAPSAAHQSEDDEQDSSRPALRVFDPILICLQCVGRRCRCCDRMKSFLPPKEVWGCHSDRRKL